LVFSRRKHPPGLATRSRANAAQVELRGEQPYRGVEVIHLLDHLVQLPAAALNVTRQLSSVRDQNPYHMTFRHRFDPLRLKSGRLCE
jgi:hypothetical protein